MSIHVAILKRPYLQAMLRGQKTIESRLMKVDMPPFDAVAEGERLFFKASGGPFMATALADRVQHHRDLTPERIGALKQEWNPAIGGPDDYWEQRRVCRFATLVHCREIEPIDVGPTFSPQNMRAWYVLPDNLTPLRDVPVTAGALANHYLSLPAASPQLREQTVRLLLPDGREVETDFADGGPMLRWRGWGPYYAAFGLACGDTVRLLAVGPRCYRVTFRRGRAAEE
jgi:hypothetical protein